MKRLVDYPFHTGARLLAPRLRGYKSRYFDFDILIILTFSPTLTLTRQQ